MRTTRHCALLQHSCAMLPACCCCGGAALVALVMVWQRAQRTLAAPAGYSSSVRHPLHTICACVAAAAEQRGEGRHGGSTAQVRTWQEESDRLQCCTRYTTCESIRLSGTLDQLRRPAGDSALAAACESRDGAATGGATLPVGQVAAWMSCIERSKRKQRQPRPRRGAAGQGRGPDHLPAHLLVAGLASWMFWAAK